MPLTLSTRKLLNGSGQIVTYKGLIKKNLYFSLEDEGRNGVSQIAVKGRAKDSVREQYETSLAVTSTWWYTIGGLMLGKTYGCISQ